MIRRHRASFDPFDKLRAGKLRTGRAWGNTASSWQQAAGRGKSTEDRGN